MQNTLWMKVEYMPNDKPAFKLLIENFVHPPHVIRRLDHERLI